MHQWVVVHLRLPIHLSMFRMTQVMSQEAPVNMTRLTSCSTSVHHSTSEKNTLT